MKTKNWGWVFLGFLTPVAMPSWSQDAGSLLRQQEQQQEQRRQSQSAPEQDESVGSPSELPAPDAGGPTVSVTTLTLTGAANLLSSQERAALRAQVEGRQLDFAGLQALAAQITRQLQQKGHPLARAVLPRQDVTEGVIEVLLLEGTLERWEFSRSDNVRISPSLLTNIAHRAAPPGEPVSGPDLERGLLLMNDLPGVSAQARLEPGDADNTSRLVTQIDEGPVFNGSAWVDNYGNWTTGKNQASALLRLNDPLGGGEQANLLMTYSKGLQLGRLGLERGLGSNGLRVNAAVTALNYEIVEGGAKDLDLTGTTRAGQLGVTYPFVRSRRTNVRGAAEIGHKQLRDEIGSTRLRDKRINYGTLTLSGDRVDNGGGFNTWSLAYTGGDLDLSRVEADEAADKATLQTAGDYHKINASLMRLQPLPGAFSMLLRASGQWANKNLDSSEAMTLGGPYAVRAYPVNEASGDLGWLATAELRYDVLRPWHHGRLQLAAFYDVGGIRLNEDVPDGFTIATESGRNSYSLSGAGLAARFQHRDRYALQIGWARAIGDNPGRSLDGRDADGKRDRSRVWMQAVVEF